jgi:Ca2+-binding EF-hand superfamily protein
LSCSHPIDKYANKSDDQIAFLLSELGRRSRVSDEDGVREHVALMDQVIFDERTEGLSDSCVSLMKELMHMDPKKRMSSQDFLRHPWVQGLTASWDLLEKTHAELEGFWQNRFRTEILKKFAAVIDTTPKNGQPLSEENLKTMFDALDLKNNGVLELGEIITTFEELGVSEKQTRQIFSFADLDGSGVVSWDEFRTLMRNEDPQNGGSMQVRYLQNRFRGHVLSRYGVATNKPLDLKQLREIFDDIDLEGNGYLDPHELRVLLRSVGEPEDVISKIMASLDLSGSRQGGLTWPAFQRIMGFDNPANC